MRTDNLLLYTGESLHFLLHFGGFSGCGRKLQKGFAHHFVRIKHTFIPT
ncbi:hypothetical protein BVRB_6g128930 [Beta vulgaris subsp. vulgaris]|nr:hypothetical protein BVRB_6g128930 [Beta vulgaris subsp. vulgaris]